MTERTLDRTGAGGRRVVAAAAGAPRRGHHPGIALALIVSFTLMAAVDATIVNVALPKIQSSLHMSTASLSWVVSAYLLAFGGLLMAGGRIGNILGLRPVFVVGVGLFTVASVVGGFAPTAGWLLAARAVQGVGAAFALPTALALIISNFGEGPARNRAITAYTAMIGAGASLGLVLGGMLAAWASWRWVLFVNVPVGLAVAVLAPLYIRAPARHPGRVDVAGTVTLTGAVVCLVYGFIRVPSSGWTDGGTLAALVGAGTLLASFIVIEGRVAEPVVPLRLLADRNRAGGYFNTLVLTAATLGEFYFLTQFLQNVQGYSPIRAGLAFLPMSLGMLATVRTMPLLVARFGAKACMVAGAALATGASLWLCQLAASSSYLSGVLGPTALIGIGLGSVYLPMNMTTLAGVAQRDSGSASGVLQAAQQIGAASGLAILVTVFGIASRRAAEHPPAGATADAQSQLAFMHGIQSAFLGSAIFTACALAVVLFVIRPEPART
jgi:EmrB/QacA subfamily drug resistance transporter